MIWNLKVSKSKLLIFQLVRKEHGIKDQESGSLLPTPKSRDYHGSEGKRVIKTKTGWSKERKGSKVRYGASLNDVVDHQQMFPTPRASGQENAETLIKRKGIKKAFQHNLTAAVQMLPTPNAWDSARGARSQKNLREKKHQINILTAIKDHNSEQPVIKWNYPTPAQRDYKDTTISKSYQNRNSDSLPIKMMKDGKPGGKLNPNFVEFLMGYNTNYTQIEPTELKHLETQSYHKSQQKSEKQLLKQKK